MKIILTIQEPVRMKCSSL